jgi:glyoxylase-like metal-dependent hydrolase (beta-lactamase superfamily II)
MELCDEFDGGFGWIEEGFMRRCAHALVAEGRVWLVDPFDVDGLEEQVLATGEPGGVIQLLDRHARDCEAIARQLGVPLHRLEAPEPFEAIPLATVPRWHEIALWWPGRRVLVAADALGTARYFRAGDERLGVHPLLRAIPPRRLGRLRPERVLVGHGEGVHEDAAAALDEALATARRRIPAYLWGGFRAHVLGRR